MADVRVGEWSGIENRKHKRVPLKISIECRHGDAAVEVRSENISVNGLLVRSSDPFPQDTEITVSFRLPGSSLKIQSQARVAHVVPDAFMGLELLSLAAEARAEIERFVGSTVPAGKPA
jgi:uncharacterized protein (TIGR02266 family)